MATFNNLSYLFGSVILTSVIAIILLIVLISVIRRGLLKKAKTKQQISNIKIFSKILTYAGIVILAIIIFLAFFGGFTGIGLTLGLLTAALGWALQRPITGMAAWVMIVLKRPFQIGDRIIVAGVRGDVIDISLTHIYLGEVGGVSTSEERSGRIIMVPNSILFEQNIINFTQEDDNILDEIVTPITFDSNLKKTKKIVIESAKKILKKHASTKRDPYIRTYFHPSGINVHIRYFSPAMRRQEISSMITEEIFEQIAKYKDIEYAYQHTQIIYKGKK